MPIPSSNSEGGTGREHQPVLVVAITDEIRQLADALVQAFDVFLVGKQDRSGIRGSPDDRTLRFSLIILVLKIVDGTREAALRSVSRLGTVKNNEFPSSLKEHYYRCHERDMLNEFRETGRPIADAVVGTRAYLPAIVPLGLGSLTPAQRFGHDPLEKPEALQGGGDAGSEVLIFLEHYLPHELADTIRDLADTQCEDCQISERSLSLLTEFNCCFRSFTIIRSAFPKPDRGFSRFLDEAHAKLLRLAECVQSNVTSQASFEALNDKSEEFVSAESEARDNLRLDTDEAKKLATTENNTVQSANRGGLAAEFPNDPHRLHIKIRKHPTDHFEIICGGVIKQTKSSQKRTIIAIALSKQSGITPQQFCQIYLGGKSERAPAQMYDCLKSAGLLLYRTKSRPYRFPMLTFELENTTSAELHTFLTESAREKS